MTGHSLWPLANRHLVDCIYIDFKRAFDVVCHSKLITELQAYGIGGKLLTWISAFLSNRTQRVSVSGKLSTAYNVTSGEHIKAVFLGHYSS